MKKIVLTCVAGLFILLSITTMSYAGDIPNSAVRTDNPTSAENSTKLLLFLGGVVHNRNCIPIMDEKEAIGL